MLIPQFGGLIWTILAFVVALSVIVAIHEYGHYIVGKKTGIFPEVFSLGFGPVLFSRVDSYGTRWQIAALPLGGYVKFRGDANASGGTDAEAVAEMSEAEKRTTMTGAPLWARSLTVLAGPVFNFVLSALIFTGIFMMRGEVADPLTVGELRALPVTQELREGDEILQIAGMRPPAFADRDGYGDFMDALPIAPTLPYTVSRDGTTQEVDGPYVYPPLATQIVPRSAASDAGLRPGDVITEVNGEPIYAFSQIQQIVEASEGATLALTVWRDGATRDLSLSPRATDEPQADNSFRQVYRIGIVGGMAFEPAAQPLGVGAAIGQGVTQVGAVIQSSLSGLWHMITGAISTCNLSGPIGIAEVSGSMASQGADSFIWFIAVLSTAVGLLNLFPIPVLDGGHLVFHAYEAVTGKPPGDRAIQVLMTIGLTLVLGMMLFALTNDIFCP